MAIINGRRIDPASFGGGVHGSELARNAYAGHGRRPIIEKGGSVSLIDPGRYYSRDELVDKRGRGAKITSMPDRSKGDGRSRRSDESKRIITEQVIDLAANVYKQGVEFDEETANWLVVPDYSLPPNWHHISRSTALMVWFPRDYPHLPPVGFYLPDDLPSAHDGHLFGFAVHGASDAPIRENWKWYCVYVEQGAWRPSSDWRRGDNLFTYFHLIREAVGHAG